jgi:methionyl-tRNA synthetase
LARAASTSDAAIERVAIHESIGAVADFVSTVNGYVTEQEPWKVAKDESPEARARLATILYAAAESLRAIAVLHHSVMPKATLALWEALGAEELGELSDQPIAEVGRWGQLPVGARLTKGASLFPRLEEES